MSSATTIETALADAGKAIAKASDSPRLDAETLLAWVLGASRSYLFTHPEHELSAESARDFADAIARRQKGEPVAYITGSKEFWSLQLKVSPDTLVPRPETETLVEQALALIPRDRPSRVLDLGTGCGAVAIAIASGERPGCEIVATDTSGAALEIARENAARHGLDNVRFVEGDWTEPVSDDCFDLIVSNPPYVRDDDPAFSELRYEPRPALSAGPDGLDAIRKIAEEVRYVIADQGSLLLEHGATQESSVADILRERGWTNIRCFKDLSGHPRVTTAKMETSSRKDHP